MHLERRLLFLLSLYFYLNIHVNYFTVLERGLFHTLKKEERSEPTLFFVVVFVCLFCIPCVSELRGTNVAQAQPRKVAEACSLCFNSCLILLILYNEQNT